MARKFLRQVFLGCFMAVLAGCSKAAVEEKGDKPQVVATTAMIGELVSFIGADKIELSCLIKGDIDPHSYELVKGDRAKLKAADLIFYQGLGLEHGASLIAYLKAEEKAIPIGEVLKKDYPESLIYQDGYIDPHIWLDLDLWQKIVPSITEHLVKLQPDNRAFFEERAQELMQKMEQLDHSMRVLLEQVPEEKRYLVTAHSAFSYFTRRYIAPGPQWRVHCIAPEGLAPEAQISLYDIEKVVSYIALHHINVIFSESNVSKDALYKIIDVCSKSGLEVILAPEPLFGDALFNQKGYLDMMWHNATLLHNVWHGQTTLLEN